jgi:putative ATPase
MGAGKGYRYPHDYPGGIVEQQYAPDVIHGRTYYEPSEREPGAAARSADYRRALGHATGDASAAASGAGSGDGSSETGEGGDAAAAEWRPRCNPEKPV